MLSQGFLKEHSSTLLFIMRFLDSSVLLLSGFIAHRLYLGDHVLNSYYQIALIIAWLLSLIIFPAYGVYRPWRGVSRGRELASVLLAWSTVFAVLVFFAFATGTSIAYSRVWLFSWALFGGASLLMVRFSLRTILGAMRVRGYNQRHIIIIGSGDVAVHAYRSLSEAKEAGFIIDGFFSNDVDVAKRSENSLYMGALSEARAFADR